MWGQPHTLLGSAVLFELARIKQYPQTFLRKKFDKNLFALFSLGNTERRLCANCAVSFFVRLHRFSEGILPYFKEKMCNMTEKMQVSCVQSLQAVFVRCCLKRTAPGVLIKNLGGLLFYEFCNTARMGISSALCADTTTVTCYQTSVKYLYPSLNV